LVGKKLAVTKQLAQEAADAGEPLGMLCWVMCCNMKKTCVRDTGLQNWDIFQEYTSIAW